MNWEAQTQTKIDLVLQQIMAWGSAMGQDGKLPPIPGQATLLRELYEQALPLARLMDRAHLTLHAEGPGASHSGPRLNALNWLSGTSERVLKSLCASWLDSKSGNGKQLVKHLDLRLAGMAPGSLWLGFRFEPVHADLLAADTALIEALSARVGLLPQAARFIGDESMEPAIVEAIPDPAERDMLLDGLLRLTPTGSVGVHTVGVSSPAHGQVSLGGRERVVLRDALRKPTQERMKDGAFVGEVRAVDMDRTRLHLHTAHGVVRCVMPAMDKHQARQLLGEPVKLVGRYASDKDGTPRLLYVERAEPIVQQTALIA